MVRMVHLVHRDQGTFHRPFLRANWEKSLFSRDAPQPMVAIAVKVDEVSTPAQKFKRSWFSVPCRSGSVQIQLIRVETTSSPCWPTVVLDHLLNDRGQFLQERLVAVNSRQE